MKAKLNIKQKLKWRKKKSVVKLNSLIHSQTSYLTSQMTFSSLIGKTDQFVFNHIIEYALEENEKGSSQEKKVLYFLYQNQKQRS